MNIDLRISGKNHAELFRHLFPGDGKESVAIALCGRLKVDNKEVMLIHKITFIPNEDCYERTDKLLKWSTKSLIPLLEEATKKSLGILKIHSHPTGFPEFSTIDDISDRELFDSIHAWIDNGKLHGSAIMLPDGRMFGRVINSSLDFIPFSKIVVVGDDVNYYFSQNDNQVLEEFSLRTRQAFGEGTTRLLHRLTAAIVGCSGTGSPVIEQLARLGFKKVLLIDPDVIENKNLNRIINSKKSDAEGKKYKVDVLKEAILNMGLNVEVESYHENIYDNIELIKRIASVDVLFGCVDSIDGRHLLNQISTFYIVPYFDLGVKLIADGQGGIEQIWGTVNYLQPGLSSLLTRGVYSNEDLRASSLYRIDPVKYIELKKEGYIKNVNVDSPAVISVNMQVASLAVIELLARVHKFRYDSNKESAITRISMSDGYIQKESEGPVDRYLEKFVGRGDMVPFLNMVEFNFQ